MDMVNLTQYIGRRVSRINDGVVGKVVELGNYDDDDDLEFKVVLDNGEEVIVDTDKEFEDAGLRLV